MQSSGVQDSGAASTAVATRRNGLLWPRVGSYRKVGAQCKGAVLLPELISLCCWQRASSCVSAGGDTGDGEG